MNTLLQPGWGQGRSLTSSWCSFTCFCTHTHTQVCVFLHTVGKATALITFLRTIMNGFYFLFQRWGYSVDQELWAGLVVQNTTDWLNINVIKRLTVVTIFNVFLSLKRFIVQQRNSPKPWVKGFTISALSVTVTQPVVCVWDHVCGRGQTVLFLWALRRPKMRLTSCVSDDTCQLHVSLSSSHTMEQSSVNKLSILKRKPLVSFCVFVLVDLHAIHSSVHCCTALMRTLVDGRQLLSETRTHAQMCHVSHRYCVCTCECVCMHVRVCTSLIWSSSSTQVWGQAFSSL